MVRINLDLPESFFEEETRWDFLITKKQKEIWAIELDLLMKLDEVCKILGIRYFLDSGTLLGAVRDGHFIPWDDDIDVIMLRDDYDKLLKDGNKLFSKPYFLQNAYTDYGYFRGHSQLRNSDTCAILAHELGKESFNQGIFIDIFVLDGIAEGKLKQQMEERERLLHIRSFLKYPVSPNRLKRLVKPTMIWYYKKKFGDLSGLYSRIEKIFKENDDTEYIDKLLFRKKDAKLMRLKRAWFDESIQMDFEGFSCPVPKEYENILEVYYGDNYMKPDPKYANMHSEFGDVLFDTDRSYRDVLLESGFEI